MADTSGLGPDASAWGFKSLIAHHFIVVWRSWLTHRSDTPAYAGSSPATTTILRIIASIIQRPGSLPSKQMMRVRFPLDAPLPSSTIGSASGSDPEGCRIVPCGGSHFWYTIQKDCGVDWSGSSTCLISRPTRVRVPASATILFGGVAQLVERLLCKQNVAGSIPTISTKDP